MLDFGRVNTTLEEIGLCFGQYVALLSNYQEKGRIRADIDISVLCDLLIGIGNAALARLVTTPSMNVETMREIGLPHLRMVLSGVVVPSSEK